MKEKNLLDDYTDEELEKILTCDEMRDLKVYFSEDARSERLVRLIRGRIVIKHRYTNNRKAVFNALADYPSYPSYPLGILLGIITITQIGFIPLLVLTSLFTVMTTALLIIYYLSSRKSMARETNRSDKALQLDIFKLYCLEELNYRHSRRNLSLVNHPVNIVPPSLETFSDKLQNNFYANSKDTIGNIKPAVGVGVFASYTLFCGYYLSVHTIATALGFSAFAGILGGPISLGVAAIVFAGIGIGFGIHYYYMCKEKERSMRLQKDVNHRVNLNKNTYLQMKKDEKKYQQMKVEYAKGLNDGLDNIKTQKIESSLPALKRRSSMPALFPAKQVNKKDLNPEMLSRNKYFKAASSFKH